MNNQLETAEKFKALAAPFLEKGFVFSYLYQKGGDSSCVYIFRFQKGRDYFDLREVSGGNELNFVVYVNGVYAFPSLKRLYPKQHRAFFFKRLLGKGGADERRKFIVGLLNNELLSGKPDFFGIAL